jgi:CHASE3 domain sensor protein
MLEPKLAQLQARRNNIRRYRRLLNTKLTELERGFILRRLEEEEQAVESLSGGHLEIQADAALKMQPRYAAEAGHV